MKTKIDSWLVKKTNPEKPIGKCDICGKRRPTRVASSATGAVSFCYCLPCLTSGREPYGAVVASLIGVDPLDGVAEWYKGSITTTLKAEGKTQEELWKDVEAAAEEYANEGG